MKQTTDTVRSSDGQEWSYTKTLPETIDEAKQVYGEDGTLYLIHSSLVVKEQAIARALFKAGKTREEVDKEVAAYKPGAKRGGSGVSKASVFNRLMDLAEKVAGNPEAKDAIRSAIKEGDWKKANELLDVLENGE